MGAVRLGGMPLLMPTLLCGLLGCSGGNTDDPNAWYNKTITEHFSGRPTLPPDNAAAGMATMAPVGTVPVGAAADSAVPLGPVPASELYRSETSCGAMLPGPGAAAAPADVSAVALQMTECEVARRVGAPDKVELGALPTGARSLTLTYLFGPHPRAYRFAAGRLVEIDNLPAEPPPARGKRTVHASQ